MVNTRFTFLAQLSKELAHRSGQTIMTNDTEKMNCGSRSAKPHIFGDWPIARAWRKFSRRLRGGLLYRWRFTGLLTVS